MEKERERAVEKERVSCREGVRVVERGGRDGCREVEREVERAV